ncbi:MAG TPA: hypothetical protein VFW73_02065 [Lacipirellulaceae bacterium]|nr:hypothetical protein [Lacipirellulaceae bacterium]
MLLPRIISGCVWFLFNHYDSLRATDVQFSKVSTDFPAYELRLLSRVGPRGVVVCMATFYHPAKLAQHAIPTKFVFPQV